MRDGSQPEAQAVSPPDRQAHRAKRRGLAPAVEAGLDNCPRCHQSILPGQAWAWVTSTAPRLSYPGSSTDLAYCGEAGTRGPPLTTATVARSSSSSGRSRGNE